MNQYVTIFAEACANRGGSLALVCQILNARPILLIHEGKYQ
jgi:hypothetical protein